MPTLLPARGVALCACLLAGVAGAQSTTLVNLTANTGLPVKRLEIDWPHSALEFTVKFMGLSTVRGAFASFGGTVMLDTVDITRSTVSVLIQTASINTNVQFRDQHLKSPDFFDAEKYPLITFHSERITRTGNDLVLHGPLTMHGVTREVDIPFRQLHPIMADAWANKRTTFQGNLSVKRSDYGIKGTAFWNSEFDPGRMSISDDVDISLLVSAKVNNVDRWTANAMTDSLLTAIQTTSAAKALETFSARLADTTLAARRTRANALDMAGVKLMQSGRFQDAVAVYAFLAANAPAVAASATAAEGEAHLMLGHRDAALKSFQRAAQLDSLNTVAAEYLRTLKH
jgi:polyisoprenoid-binding protein YceI